MYHADTMSSHDISWGYCYFQIIDLTLGLRLGKQEEEMGADVVEHGVTLEDISMSLQSLHTISLKDDSLPESEGESSNGIASTECLIQQHLFRSKAQEMFKDLLLSCHK